MKKWLHNANRGIILLAIVVLGVFIFLIFDAIKTNQQKAVIRDLSYQFITDSHTLFTFPSEMDLSDREAVKKENLTPVLSQNASPLFQYMVDNEAVRMSLVEGCYNFMYGCFFNERYPISCTRTPTEINIIEVYRGSATVDVTSNTVIEYRNAEGDSFSTTSTMTDTLRFLYQDGQWKLAAYSNGLMSSFQSGTDYIEYG